MAQNSCGTRSIRMWVFSGLATAMMFGSPSASADERAEFFESRIRPLLINRCCKCHSSETEQNGGLSLDSKAGWEIGGDSGTSIVPGDVDASLLIRAVRWDDPDVQMPPKDAGGKLSAAEIADLEAWVQRGAFDPRIDGSTAKSRRSWDEMFAERR
ncbi:MAG: hypothetical protein EHM77_09215, partial [Planctomycetaceae bacterium]